MVGTFRRNVRVGASADASARRYIVGQALGGVLKQRFEALRQQHEAEAAGTAHKALADPNAYDLTTLNEPQRKALIRFWEAWQEEENSTTLPSQTISRMRCSRWYWGRVEDFTLEAGVE